MPIASGDIHLRLSGGAANSNPLLSIGGLKSSTDWVSNLFDVVTGVESAAGDVNYRCVYIHNNHGTLTMISPKVFIQANTPAASTQIAIGLGAAAVNATETAIANEATAPGGGVAFTEPSNLAGALTTPDIPPGQHKAVWVRRTVNAGSPAINGDGFTLNVTCDTAA